MKEETIKMESIKDEDTAMMVVEGAINSHKDNLHPSRFQSSRGRMIQTST